MFSVGVAQHHPSAAGNRKMVNKVFHDGLSAEGACWPPHMAPIVGIIQICFVVTHLA